MNDFQKRIYTIILSVSIMISASTSLSAKPDSAAEITRRCKISVSSGDVKVLSDKKMSTFWACQSGESSIKVDIPNEISVAGIMVDWFKEPKGYNIAAKDQMGKVLNAYSLSDRFGSIRDYFVVDKNVKSITISKLGTEDKVSEITIYSTGALPKDVQIWESPVNKADLMVICAHQDDEFLFMGGAIPYYQGEKNLVVFYMANCGRTRRGEALDGLWTIGMHNYPVFACFPDVRTKTLQQCMDAWGNEKAVEILVKNIRKFKPDVIVTHDENGEYGHGAHSFTAYAVKKAVEKSADPDQYRESAQQYGAWQVKKLYLHLYNKNQIQLDWNKPMTKFDGYTALEMASIGFSKHVSQQKNHSMKEGILYDNQKFGLAFTAVGLDSKKDDFFENIIKTENKPLQDVRVSIEQKKKSTSASTLSKNETRSQNYNKLIQAVAIFLLAIAFLLAYRKNTRP